MMWSREIRSDSNRRNRKMKISVEQVIADCNISVKKAELIVAFLADDDWNMEDFEMIKGLGDSDKALFRSYVRRYKGKVEVEGQVQLVFCKERVAGTSFGSPKWQLIPKDRKSVEEQSRLERRRADDLPVFEDGTPRPGSAELGLERLFRSEPEMGDRIRLPWHSRDRFLEQDEDEEDQERFRSGYVDLGRKSMERDRYDSEYRDNEEDSDEAERRDRQKVMYHALGRSYGFNVSNMDRNRISDGLDNEDEEDSDRTPRRKEVIREYEFRDRTPQRRNRIEDRDRTPQRSVPRKLFEESSERKMGYRNVSRTPIREVNSSGRVVMTPRVVQESEFRRDRNGSEMVAKISKCASETVVRRQPSRIVEKNDHGFGMKTPNRIVMTPQSRVSSRKCDKIVMTPTISKGRELGMNKGKELASMTNDYGGKGKVNVSRKQCFEPKVWREFAHLSPGGSVIKKEMRLVHPENFPIGVPITEEEFDDMDMEIVNKSNNNRECQQGVGMDRVNDGSVCVYNNGIMNDDDYQDEDMEQENRGNRYNYRYRPNNRKRFDSRPEELQMRRALDRAEEEEREALRDEEGIRKTMLTKSLPSLATYDGRTSWKVFHRLFVTYADLRGWNELEQKKMLSVHLREEAALYFDGIRARSIQDIFGCMEKRFGRITTEVGLRESFANMVQGPEETAVEFAGRLRDTASDCYRDQDERFIESELIRQFFKGCTDKAAALQAAGHKFETVQDAVVFVVGYTERQASLGITKKLIRSSSTVEDEQMTTLIRAVSKLTDKEGKDERRRGQTGQGGGQRGQGAPPGACYACHQVGHRAFQCKEAVCYRCEKVGHIKSRCPYYECYKCNALHLKSEVCPLIKCHICGENHRAANCPKND